MKTNVKKTHKKKQTGLNNFFEDTIKKFLHRFKMKKTESVTITDLLTKETRMTNSILRSLK